MPKKAGMEAWKKQRRMEHLENGARTPKAGNKICKKDNEG